MSFDRQNINKLIYSKSGGNLNVRKDPSTNNTPLFSVTGKNSAGRTTGHFAKMQDGNWYQIALYKTINGSNYGYVRSDVIRTEIPSNNSIAESNGEKLIDLLIKKDIALFQKLKEVIKGYKVLEKKGIDITSLRNSAKGIFSRFLSRQNFINNSDLLRVEKSYNASISGIGVAPVVIAIAVAAGAGLTVLAYYALKPYYDQSVQDFKIASELHAKIKDALTPSEYEKFMADSNSQLKEAYNAGATKGTFSGMFTILKPIAFALGGFWLADKFIFNKKS